MLKIHESPEYQDFLISEQRKGLIPPDLYDALIPEYFDGLQVLDFGCGLGYTAAFYAEKFEEYDDFHIYACDHQVEVIDALWKRITDNQFKNVTVFHMPDRPRLHFPKWVPPVHHLFLSLSLVTTDNPVDILTTLRPMILDEGLIHIIEWDKNKSHRELDEIFPSRHRFSFEQVESYLDQAKYEIVRSYRVAGPYMALSAKPYFGEKKDAEPQNHNNAPNRPINRTFAAPEAPPAPESPPEFEIDTDVKTMPGQTPGSSQPPSPQEITKSMPAHEFETGEPPNNFSGENSEQEPSQPRPSQDEQK